MFANTCWAPLACSVALGVPSDGSVDSSGCWEKITTWGRSWGTNGYNHGYGLYKLAYNTYNYGIPWLYIHL
jgi:hypothetical protein